MKFTEEQMKILDCISPFIQVEYQQSRKGMSQGFPYFNVLEGDTYWCEDSNQLETVPKELVGDWISESLEFEDYISWKDIRNYDWKKAEYKAVVTHEWIVKDGEQG